MIFSNKTFSYSIGNYIVVKIMLQKQKINSPMGWDNKLNSRYILYYSLYMFYLMYIFIEKKIGVEFSLNSF